MIKLGVVGVGAWGYIHLKRLIEYSNDLKIEVVGFYDINKERIKYVIDTLNVSFYELEDLYSLVDGLIIATPPTTHYKIASKAIIRGIDLLIEKPFSTCIEDAYEILRLTRKHGVKVLIGYIMRFNPVVKELKRVLLEGELGDPVVLTSKRVGPRGRRVRDVGVILDLATHDIDISRYVLGEEPLQLFSIYGSKYGEYEDYSTIMLKFKDVTVIIETNLLTHYKLRTVTATCTDGVFNGDYINNIITIAKGTDTKEYTALGVEPLVAEHKHFINVIRGVEEPLCNIDDGINNLKIALAALKNRGKLVKLEL